MHELYAFPNSYALGVHLLLEESGAPYQVIDVRENGALEENSDGDLSTAAEDFKSVSPHQRVPALKLPGGGSLCESGAIALYLGDTLSDGIFGVSTEDERRPEYLQWLFYLSSTLQPEVMLQFHPEDYFTDTDQQNALQKASMERLSEVWTVLESRYAAGPWMFNNRPTAVDFALAPVLSWPECFPADGQNLPNLTRTLSALKERQACKSVWSWHSRESLLTGNPKGTTKTSMVTIQKSASKNTR